MGQSWDLLNKTFHVDFRREGQEKEYQEVRCM